MTASSDRPPGWTSRRRSFEVSPQPRSTTRQPPIGHGDGAWSALVGRPEATPRSARKHQIRARGVAVRIGLVGPPLIPIFYGGIRVGQSRIRIAGPDLLGWRSLLNLV